MILMEIAEEGNLLQYLHAHRQSNFKDMKNYRLDISFSQNVFEERNIPYPFIYNPYDLLLLLDKLPVRITNMHDLCLTTFDFTSFYVKHFIP